MGHQKKLMLIINRLQSTTQLINNGKISNDLYATVRKQSTSQSGLKNQ
jgi:hypothetical protein